MFKGLFDTQTRLAKIDRNSDPLKQLNELIDWEIFRPELSLLRENIDVSKGGRPPIAPLLKFTMLILQSLYNLSDDSLEQQVLDRLSFMRFLGLTMGDDVPDAKTIWAFRERLKEHGLTEKLFARFGEHLDQSGFDSENRAAELGRQYHPFCYTEEGHCLLSAPRRWPEAFFRSKPRDFRLKSTLFLLFEDEFSKNQGGKEAVLRNRLVRRGSLEASTDTKGICVYRKTKRFWYTG